MAIDRWSRACRGGRTGSGPTHRRGSRFPARRGRGRRRSKAAGKAIVRLVATICERAILCTRHQFATQDLQREQNQRVFIRALLAKMLSPGTLLNPLAIIPAASGSASALTMDQGTHLKDLISVAFALRNPETTTVPIANANYFTPAGDAVQWNRPQALQLFNDLRTDRHIPTRLLTGSRLAG